MAPLPKRGFPTDPIFLNAHPKPHQPVWSTVGKWPAYRLRPRGGSGILIPRLPEHGRKMHVTSCSCHWLPAGLPIPGHFFQGGVFFCQRWGFGTRHWSCLRWPSLFQSPYRPPYRPLHGFGWNGTLAEADRFDSRTIQYGNREWRLGDYWDKMISKFMGWIFCNIF